jgi:hypothetical protein
MIDAVVMTARDDGQAGLLLDGVQRRAEGDGHQKLRPAAPGRQEQRSHPAGG